MTNERKKEREGGVLGRGVYLFQCHSVEGRYFRSKCTRVKASNLQVLFQTHSVVGLFINERAGFIIGHFVKNVQPKNCHQITLNYDSLVQIEKKKNMRIKKKNDNTRKKVNEERRKDFCLLGLMLEARW